MRLRPVVLLVAAALLACAVGVHAKAASERSKAKTVILCYEKPSVLEVLAAREVRRYVYLRTGRLLPIIEVGSQVPASEAIVVARKDRPIARRLAADGVGPGRLADLRPQGFLLKTIRHGGRRLVLLIGGDDVGTLYAAYRFAERLGVRFYLHGDVVPDQRVPFGLPDLDERGSPLFDLRGIQPFHDFPEGPDWWNVDDYKAIIGQLPKLRMNFIGLHTYPEGHPNAEPTVWIGLPEDVREDGRVAFAYPATYQNTLRGNWGYEPKKTSEFVFGAAALFDRDAFGADVMAGLCPRPQEPADCIEVFNRAGAMLREAFRYARLLGVKTCVGTETPLTIPKRVGERLRALGKDRSRSAVVQRLYEGVFLRASRAYPLDYYWLWTPEGWTWRGASDETVEKTVADIRLAYKAAKAVGAPFRLATCGWVLGPQGDRAMFDRVLPKDVAVGCINRQVGNEPIEPAFERIHGRDKWAIPWLEDDPGLTAPQLWVGRMRRDAFDALRYGCTGLMGIHWRTRILGPNVLALAWAAWNQEPWGKEAGQVSGPVGGRVASFPNNPIDGTEDDPLYQTVRYDVSAYRLRVPDGVYRVVLQFCEPHYKAKGKRVFDVKIEGRKVIEKLDIFARVGQNKALDYAFDDVRVSDGRLDIDFIPRVEYPSIAAISVQGRGFTMKINCGGPAYRNYVADPPPPPRYMATSDFYRDWALYQFGPEVADAAAGLFEKLDGALPRPAQWVGGPGGLKPDPRPWEKVGKEYAFVGELEALRPEVRGAGNLERFDYWLNSFRYMRAMARVRCLWAQYERAIKKVRAEKDPQVRARLANETALPLRRRLVELVGGVYRYLLQTVSTTGGMGTVANWEQHILPRLLDRPGRQLAEILGGELPPDAMAPKEYGGPPRLIVPTVRGSVLAGEVLKLKVIVLARRPARQVSVFWRPMGSGAFERIAPRHVARGVYLAEFPPRGARGDALEYYVEAATADGRTLRFPPSAPGLSQTVVVIPGQD